MEDRDAIVDALRAANVPTATGGRFAAPVVVVEPGDPWTEPHRLPGRISRWHLTAIAGRADSTAALSDLANLVEATDTALRTIPGVQLPTWRKPSDYPLEGVPHASTVATVQFTT